MELNDRVMTVLCSSASGSNIVAEAIPSSGCPAAQLIATLWMPRDFNNSPALITSDVLPDREMSIGSNPFPVAKVGSG